MVVHSEKEAHVVRLTQQLELLVAHPERVGQIVRTPARIGMEWNGYEKRTVQRDGRKAAYVSRHQLQLQIARHIHIKMLFSSRVTLMRPLFANHKSMLFVCALKSCRLNVSFVSCSDVHLFRAHTPDLSVCTLKGRSNST